MNKIFVYIPENGSNCRIKHKLPIRLSRRPIQLWSLYENTNEKEKPSEETINLSHRKGAFLEDYVHDYNWDISEPDILRYYSRITTGNIWICLLIDDGNNKL